MMTSDWPSEEVERTSSTSLMVLTESSTFLEISVSISSEGGAHLVHLADGVDRVFHLLGDFGFDLLGGSAGVDDGHDDGGDIDLGEQVDAEREVGKNADHDQRENQHGGEDGAADAKLGECMHGLPCLHPSAVEELVQGACGHGLVAGESVDDADLAAIDFADDDHAEAGGVVVDGEDLVGIGGLVADYGVARHEDGAFAAGQ